jgi:hypothetical protein
MQAAGRDVGRDQGADLAGSAARFRLRALRRVAVKFRRWRPGRGQLPDELACSVPGPGEDQHPALAAGQGRHDRRPLCWRDGEQMVSDLGGRRGGVHVVPRRAARKRRARMPTSGREKPSVLPEPVWAHPRGSRPARASGSTAAWMGRGTVMPSSARTTTRGAGTQRAANVTPGAVGSPGRRPDRCGRAIRGRPADMLTGFSAGRADKRSSPGTQVAASSKAPRPWKPARSPSDTTGVPRGYAAKCASSALLAVPHAASRRATA